MTCGKTTWLTPGELLWMLSVIVVVFAYLHEITGEPSASHVNLADCPDMIVILGVYALKSEGER